MKLDIIGAIFAMFQPQRRFLGGAVGPGNLPRDYDPRIKRSGPPSRGSSRKARAGLNVCGCGFRTKKLLRMQQHRCRVRQ